jgi:hypothetical protein
MNEEEVDDLTGLESSVTRVGALAEARAKGHTTPPEGAAEDPAAVATSALVEGML